MKTTDSKKYLGGLLGLGLSVVLGLSAHAGGGDQTLNF